jgi:hypothetical protein
MEMQKHALGILEAAESWEWPDASRIQASGEISGKFKALTPRFLSALILESQALGGTLLDQFWDAVGRCQPRDRFAENGRSRLPLNISSSSFPCPVTILRRMPFLSPLHSEALLFEGIIRKSVVFDPIFHMASELFTHLGVACESCYLSPEALVNNVTYLTSVINPGGRKSGSGTPYSVSKVISEETEILLAMAAQCGLGKRKQTALKTLACRKIN